MKVQTNFTIDLDVAEHLTKIEAGKKSKLINALLRHHFEKELKTDDKTKTELKKEIEGLKIQETVLKTKIDEIDGKKEKSNWIIDTEKK